MIRILIPNYMKKQTFLIVALMALWATCLQAQKLIPYRSGELWGYCTPDKKIVIEPQFEFASWFYEGLARVANHCDYDCYDVYDGKWGYIDTKGNIVIPIEYDDGFDFVKGFTYVRKDTTWYKINKKGKVVHQFSSRYYYNVSSFKELQPYLNVKIPEGYEEVNFDYYKGNKNFKGYRKNKTEYWEDPESLFFFPIDTIIHDVLLMFVNEYDEISNRRIETSDLGNSRPPSIAVIRRNESNELKAVKAFNLELTNKDYLLNQIKGDAKMKSRLDTLLSIYPETRFYRIIDFKSFQSIQLSNNEKMILTYPIRVPIKDIEKHLILRLMRLGIEFVNTAFWYHTSLYELTKPYHVKNIIENMTDDLHKTAKALKEMGDEQNVMITDKDNPYAEKMLFDVMENATDKDVMEFLKYVNARPFIYMGGRYKFSEVFATWVVNGAPRVIEKK
jgi:hypothetical protein